MESIHVNVLQLHIRRVALIIVQLYNKQQALHLA